jgi:hypothetical protein
MSENFKGIFIPADIFLIKDLSLAEKILIVTILGLDNGVGCYASNEYLSKFVQITPTSCSGIISKLKKSGLLFEPKKFDGRKRYLSVNTNLLNDMPIINMDADIKKDLSSISNIERQSNEKDKAAYKKPEGSIMDIVRQPNENHNHINIDNNIDINIDINIDYNIDSNIGKTDFSFLENDPEIISLNDKKTTQEILPVVVYKKPKSDKVKSPQIYPVNFTTAIIRAVENFIEYRKEINKPFKSEKSLLTKVNQFSDQIEAYGELIVLDSIQTAVANGWQGTFIDMKKVEQQNKQQTNSNNQFKTKRDENFAKYFNELRDVDFGFND